MSFKLAAGKDSPVVNLAIIINGWGSDGATFALNGKNIPQGKDFRIGHSAGFRADDLIEWIKVESTEPVKITLSPVSERDKEKEIFK